MEKRDYRGDTGIAKLVRGAQSILSETEQVYDLVDRRFALKCVELESYFSSNQT